VITIRLDEFASSVGGTLVKGSDASVDVTGVAYRSNKVLIGDVFFCIPGFKHDGHDFAAEAVEQGASAIVVKRLLDDVDDVVQVLTTDPRRALAIGSSLMMGNPSSSFSLVGITGTNGKTTTTYLLESVLRAAGHITGLTGTVETVIASERRPAGRTTPESADLQVLFAQMRDAGVTAAVIEVSSHAIDLHRVDAVDFDVVAFTNLTQDHLDYHKSMEEYYAVKRRLFESVDVEDRVVNIDDPAGETLTADLGARWTVGLRPEARVRAEAVELDQAGSRFTLTTPVGQCPIRLPLVGAYNVSNALIAVGCALALGIDLEAVVAGLETAPQVPGRLERIDNDCGIAVFVDYAHTPDGLEKAITAVRDVTQGRVITVFGCGGDRDPEKRPLMGAVAGRLSDNVIVTTDNPRTEDPVGIILRIEDGLRETSSKYDVEVDRGTGIETALREARPGDSVLVAGKGHEDYQIFGDRTIHFDDREVAGEVLAGLC